MTGTLEAPVSWDQDFRPMKCKYCDSKAFAIQLPKRDLDAYYESLEEPVTLFPKLFSSLFSQGHYYLYVPLTCAKCGTEADETMFMLQSDWKPRRERTTSDAESGAKKD
jgi:hypothetical protein